MPHQCLHCGQVFETLTDEILFNGCSGCGKKKFTLTNKPMTDDERHELLERREDEIRELLRKNMEKGMPAQLSNEDSAEIQDEEWVGLSSIEAPEVIKVVETGVYEINIEKLLDDSPIIINRDGSYMVYLPSIFKRKKKKRR